MTNTPLVGAIDVGADEILVVLLSPVGGAAHQSAAMALFSMIKQLYFRLSKFRRDVQPEFEDMKR